MPIMRVSFRIEKYTYVEMPEGSDDQDAIDAAGLRDDWIEGLGSDYEVEHKD